MHWSQPDFRLPSRRMLQKEPSAQRQTLRSESVSNKICSPCRSRATPSGSGFSHIWELPIEPKDSEVLSLVLGCTKPGDKPAPRGRTYFEVLGVHPLWFWWLCGKWQLAVGLWRRWWSEWSFSLLQDREHKRVRWWPERVCWVTDHYAFLLWNWKGGSTSAQIIGFPNTPLSLAWFKFWNAHLWRLCRCDTSQSYMAFVPSSINNTGSREIWIGFLSSQDPRGHRIRLTAIHSFPSQCLPFL